MQQDKKIAGFLRDLVRDDGEGSHYAELDVGEKRGRDDDAVDEIVKRIADDNQQTAAAAIAGFDSRTVMRLALLVMTMPP